VLDEGHKIRNPDAAGMKQQYIERQQRQQLISLSLSLALSLSLSLMCESNAGVQAIRDAASHHPIRLADSEQSDRALVALRFRVSWQTR
jgi:hypothetical protein